MEIVQQIQAHFCCKHELNVKTVKLFSRLKILKPTWQ